MSRIVSPPISEFGNLRQKLEPGELQVFNLFNSLLPIDWEIYIQPHLNGLRPDFVLLHPRVGIAVFEIKDWRLNKMTYTVEARDGRPPILLATKDGIQFSIQKNNPIEKIYIYKRTS